MASVLYESIEALSRDKGIDAQIVITAVEDAIALATRKYYKTQENMRAELDAGTDRGSGESDCARPGAGACA
jgi:N utilization substance protein A